RMQRQHIITLFLSFTCLQQTVIGSVIVNGHRVQDNAMQYMASVQNYVGHMCGGFLVSDNFVLTAAHCYDSQPIRVVLGNHNLRNPQNRQIIDIDKRFRHPSYKGVSTGNDLMLLKLKKSPVLGHGVKILQLPSMNMNVKVHDLCQVVGWGATKSGGASSNDLLAANVSIIDITTCSNAWGGLPDNVICAGGYITNRGFCQGDSGGPLVCKNTAVGIVSFNKNRNCNYENDVPNVYVDVSKYIDWILKTIIFN
uniref:Peptidase S1 domain-containing protein n=1 Tax=Neogobius melanostomus TaxID=47308 RepID=A0A8C6T0F4_9GOBI